jgi:hypothetical protein
MSLGVNGPKKQRLLMVERASQYEKQGSSCRRDEIAECKKKSVEAKPRCAVPVQPK